MSRLAGLLVKELRQHGWVLALLAVFVGGVQGILVLGSALAPRTITMLETHASFVRLFLPVLGLALGRRLVVREYYGRTQRFLESLPLYRWELFVQKLGLGAALLGAAAAASLAIAAFVAAFKEPIGGRWVLIVLWRTEVFAAFLWAFFFTMGLLGRWRVPVYLAIALVLLYLDQTTEVSVSRLPPLSLVGDTFVLERTALPVADLSISMLLTAGLVGLGAFLALARDGSIADSLASTMSRREKVAVGVVLSLALIASSVSEPLRDEPPFEFEHARVERRSPGVAVSYLDDAHRPSARALADRLALDRAALGELLGRGSLPPLHVALRPDLEVHDYEPVALAEGDPGVLVRARFHDPGFDRARFSQVALEQVIERATDGRAAHESLAWVRSGVAGAIAEPRAARLAATYAAQRRPRYETLARWRRTEERFGADVARALAASAARVVIDEAGDARWRAFARGVLAEPAPGIFAVFSLRHDPVEARLEREADLTVERFEAAWRGRLAASRSDSLPRPRAEVAIHVEEGPLRTIAWSVRGAAPDAFCALVHAPLGPFDEVLRREDLLRDERPCREVSATPARLVGRYNEGDRVFLAVEVEALQARLRLFADRRRLR